ncbi:hypothetical protein J6590_008956 [Homalodisca vitripennis]|nr:hypothetical protein J6590_008956 [Homalodisca vitripennis]
MAELNYFLEQLLNNNSVVAARSCLNLSFSERRLGGGVSQGHISQSDPQPPLDTGRPDTALSFLASQYLAVYFRDVTTDSEPRGSQIMFKIVRWQECCRNVFHCCTPSHYPSHWYV